MDEDADSASYFDNAPDIAEVVEDYDDREGEVKANYILDVLPKQGVTEVAPHSRLVLKASARVICCSCVSCMLSFIICIAVIVVGLLLRPIDLQIDFSTFMQADVPAYIIESGIAAANKEREMNTAGRRLLDEKLYTRENFTAGRRLSGEMLYRPFDLELVYSSHGTSKSLMDAIVLQGIKRFEARLQSLPSWADLCTSHTEELDRPFCNPGLSLANYIAPKPVFAGTNEIVPTALSLLETSRDPLPIDVATHLMTKHNLEKSVLTKDTQGIEAAITKFRSVFRFNFVCCPESTAVSEQRFWLQAIRDKWRKFLIEELLPDLQTSPEDGGGIRDPEDESNYLNVDIAYDGSDIHSLEVLQVINSDIYLAFGSMGFVLAYIAFHTRSLVLSLVGLVVVCLAVPLAYVGFAFIANSSEMSIASLLSLFLIVGLGSDVLFVYTDFWVESQKNMSDASARLSYTWRYAGKATLATTVATALSFFANLASVLRPLREFGFFMGLCVMIVWFIVPLIYLPTCMFDELWFSRCRFECTRRGSSFAQNSAPSVSCKDIVCQKTSENLRAYRYLYLFIPMASLIIAAAFAIAHAETTSATPKLLPDEHPVQKRVEILAGFSDIESLQFSNVPTTIDLCDPKKLGDDCATLGWCMASQLRADSSHQCKCFSKRLGDTCDLETVTVRHRIFGKDSLTEEEMWAIGESMFKDMEKEGGVKFPSDFRLEHMREQEPPPAPVIMNNWLEGDTELRRVAGVATTMLQDPSKSTSCGWDYMCFCGGLVCDHDHTWQPQLPIGLIASGKARLLSGDRANANTSTIRKQKASELQSRQLVLGDCRRDGGDCGTLPEALLDVINRPRERKLQAEITTTVQHDRRITVQVVHGLTLQEGTPLLGARDASDAWEFNAAFEFSDPWAQRNLASFCDMAQMNDNKLYVNEMTCWIAGFKDWLRGEGEYRGETHFGLPDDKDLRFPLPSHKFHERVYEFAMTAKFKALGQSGLMQKVSDYLWLRNGQLKAAKMYFLTDVDRFSSGDSANAYKANWDEYLAKYSVPSLDGSPSAYHSSSLWVRAEVQAELIKSVIVTLAIVVVLAFMTVFVFTESIVLSLSVVIATCGVLLGLLFIIVIVMASKIGPIEVIALIVFLGYSVTYSLHVAHHYGDESAVSKQELGISASEERYQRVTYSIRSIGGGVTGSAITTLGCSLFLLLCSMNIFKKLGGVAIAVTVMSVILALFSLPAGLLILGPLSPGATIQKCKAPYKKALFRKRVFSAQTPPPLPADDESDVPALPPVGNDPVFKGKPKSPSGSPGRAESEPIDEDTKFTI